MSKVKIAISDSYGGFRLSGEAVCRIGERMGYKPSCFGLPEKAFEYGTEEINQLDDDMFEIVSRIIDKIHSLPRHNKILVDVVESLGEKASCQHTTVVVTEVDCPSDRYAIREYDGLEWAYTPESIDWVTVV